MRIAQSHRGLIIADGFNMRARQELAEADRAGPGVLSGHLRGSLVV
jgi:hypothetical protein